MKLKKFLCFLITLVLSLFGSLSAAYAEGTVNAEVTVKNDTYHYSSINIEFVWERAIEQSNNNDVIFTLHSNWYADSNGNFGSGLGFKNGALSYSGKNKLTIDLNGYTIDRHLNKPIDNGAVIYVNSNLTIIDSNSDSNNGSRIVSGGVITGGSNYNRGGGIVISENATLNFNGGTILNCISSDDGGAIFVDGSKAHLNVDGGNFYGNRTYDATTECCGGAIYSEYSNISIKNSTFEGNYAEDNGGAIFAYDGNLDIVDSKFYSNYSREEGGALFLDSDNKAIITTSIFSRNRSTDDGGAIFLDSNKGAQIRDCEMYYNHSASEGGAIHINGDRTFIIGGIYRYNTASEYGGGIYLDSMYDINIAGKLVIKDNTVSNHADDLCLQEGNFSTGKLYCGGLYEGSSIYVCSNDNSSQVLTKDIDKFQYNNYIHYDKGFKQEELKEHTVSSEGIRAEGSALGSGKLIYVLSLGGIVLLLCFVMIIVAKKRKKQEVKSDDK